MPRWTAAVGRAGLRPWVGAGGGRLVAIWVLRVVWSAQPVWSWPSPRTASRAQLRGSGAGIKVGSDASQATGAGFAPAPGPAGEVGDLAFDSGPVGAVALLPGRIALAAHGHAAAPLLGAGWRWSARAATRARRPQRADGAPGPERR